MRVVSCAAHGIDEISLCRPLQHGIKHPFSATHAPMRPCAACRHLAWCSCACLRPTLRASPRGSTPLPSSGQHPSFRWEIRGERIGRWRALANGCKAGSEACKADLLDSEACQTDRVRDCKAEGGKRGMCRSCAFCTFLAVTGQ